MSKIIAVDFDGCLCENAYPHIGAPLVDEETGLTMIEKIKMLQDDGWQVILWTCRCNERLTEAIEWCAVRGLTFDAINENVQEIKDAFDGEGVKVFADIYLDDRAVNIKDF